MLSLPFPVSVNRIWRTGNGRTYISPQYRTWKDQAYVAYIQQRKTVGRPVVGNFTYHITLDEKRRKVARDGDNRGKCVLDFLQHVGLIEDDKLANAGSWCWGPVDGCVVRVHGVVHDAA